MTIEQMHYEFKLLSNQQDTLRNKDFTPMEIDTFLNHAINAIVNRLYFDFESIQKVTDELQTLVILSPFLLPISGNNDRYIYDLNQLQYTYWHFIRADIFGKNCSKTINLKIVEHDDLSSKLSNFNVRPSLKWGRALGTISSNQLIVYTVGEFEAESLFLTYLKAPNKVSLGGYTDFNNQLLVKTDCDLPEKLHIRVVTEAVLYAQSTLEDQLGAQFSERKILMNS